MHHVLVCHNVTKHEPSDDTFHYTELELVALHYYTLFTHSVFFISFPFGGNFHEFLVQNPSFPLTQKYKNKVSENASVSRCVYF